MKYGAVKYDAKYESFDKVEFAPGLFYKSDAEQLVTSLGA
jgi:hypothetical protein